ncbi:hypothetical protein FA95DRAFT_1027749 [Auriscalpium vulgare]|uniref:Uncharacterized protein n=1 Tax=Auriscalpium vulgare TaxID=40419 RepID=A0ACB8R6L0_9AGAM|nr:hypothetical protein FA95DRAFT_1027749 [Auriscalpium vulgare]
METVGFLSADLDFKKGSKNNITFNRRYLDPNRVTYEYHTRRNGFTFDTITGSLISAGMKALAKKFDLSALFGTAPQDYTLSRDPFPSNGSLLSLLAEQVLPVALTINNTRASIPNIVITNSGGLRFDVYAGPFDKNDQLTASPFDDSFLFIPNVTLGVAKQVLPALNNAGANEKREVLEAREEELYKRGAVDMRYRRWLEEMHLRASEERRAAANLTLGYVTQDSCPGVGDDTLHTPLPFFSVPDFIGSQTPALSDDTPIDFVFINFIETQLLQTLNSLQSDKVYTTSDVQSYSPFLLNEVFGLFAQEKWN